jgi:hypothetical protein
MVKTGAITPATHSFLMLLLLMHQQQLKGATKVAGKYAQIFNLTQRGIKINFIKRFWFSKAFLCL